MNQPDCQYSPATSAWCKLLPKAELHAHLSGSIRAESLRRLLHRPGNEHIRKKAQPLLDVETGRTLKQCFELFPIIHDLITDAHTLHMLVLEVLHDFQAENTVYLELRTTPRSSQHFTPRLYLETVLKAIHLYHQRNPDGLVCRVLVSLSRHLPVEEARQTIAILKQIKNCKVQPQLADLIVGVELSGNPNKGLWQDFQPLLTDCRHNIKLPVSLHFGEVPNQSEALAMLDFKPDRIGHAVIMSDIVAHRLLNEETHLGVEVCLTSNLITKSVPDISQHPVVQALLPANHPFCLCTDDCGIFDTTLSNEYAKLLTAVNLTKRHIAQIALTGLNLRFCKDPLVSTRLHHVFRHRLKQMCSAEGYSCTWVDKLCASFQPLFAPTRATA